MSLFNLAARAGIPAARSALRWMARLKEPGHHVGSRYMSTDIAKKIKDAGKVTMWRGQDKSFAPYKWYGSDKPPYPLKAAGRWFSVNREDALRYAGSPMKWSLRDYLKYGTTYYKPGVVKKVTIPYKDYKIGHKLMKKVTPMSQEDFILLPKHQLPKVETAGIATAVANLRRLLGLYNTGGLARILEV